MLEWKTALEEALANAPSAALVMGQNGIFRNDQANADDVSLEQCKFSLICSKWPASGMHIAGRGIKCDSTYNETLLILINKELLLRMQNSQAVSVFLYVCITLMSVRYTSLFLW